MVVCFCLSVFVCCLFLVVVLVVAVVAVFLKFLDSKLLFCFWLNQQLNSMQSVVYLPAAVRKALVSGNARGNEGYTVDSRTLSIRLQHPWLRECWKTRPGVWMCLYQRLYTAEPVPEGGVHKWGICSDKQTSELFITG